MESLQLEIKTVEEAPNYKKLNKAGENWQKLTIEKVVVIKEGADSGSPTLDIQLMDEKGNKFIAMTTGKLMRMITSVSNPMIKE